MHPLRGRARLLGGCAGVRMALGTQCAGFLPGSEPYQWQMPIAERGGRQAQLRAVRMPRAEPGWGSPPRGSVPRGPCSPAGSVGEYNIAVLICALQEGDTGMLLPVSHGLPEDCPLAACGRKSQAVTLSSQWELGALHPLIQCYSQSTGTLPGQEAAHQPKATRPRPGVGSQQHTHR